jgi:AsmA protein
MGKALKVLGWLIGMIVVLIIAAVILIPMFVDPNDHKERIIAEVKKATGRDLGIDGEIGLSVFPWLALELNGLTLSNAPGFNTTEFATVQHAQVRVNLLPLLFKQILEVDTVRLEGMRLYLAKSKTGVTNWEDLTGGKKSDEAETSPKEPQKEKDLGIFAFSIGGLNVENASVVWDDQSTGNHYEVEDIFLETGELVPGQHVDLNFGLSLTSKQPRLSSDISLTSRFLVEPSAQLVSLENLDIRIKVLGEGLPQKGVSGGLRADVILDLQNNTLNVDDFEVESGKLKLSGEVAGLEIQSEPVFKGNLNLASFNPSEWSREFDITLPKTADPDVLRSVSVSSSFEGTADLIKLQDLLVKLDQSTLKGELEVVDFASPRYLFTLDLDQINLDRYLPPPDESPGSGATTTRPGSKKASQEEPLFPTEMLRQLGIDGSVRIGDLVVNKLHAKAIFLKVRGRDGKIDFKHEIGRFYDGLLEGDVQLNVQGEQPKLTLNQTASRIMSGPLLLDLTGKDTLLGSGNLKMNLTSQGNTITHLKRSLNGDASFDFRDGAVKGFNLAKMIRETKARLKGEDMVVLKEPEQTDFSELTGKLVIENGVINNQNLLAKSPYLRVDGSGKAYLLEERLKYSIRPVIVNTPAGQGGESLKELKGIPIPVKITGKWSDLNYKIQLSKILKDQQKAKLKKKYEDKIDEKVSEELEEKLPEELQDKLKDKLKDMF